MVVSNVLNRGRYGSRHRDRDCATAGAARSVSAVPVVATTAGGISVGASTVWIGLSVIWIGVVVGAALLGLCAFSRAEAEGQQESVYQRNFHVAQKQSFDKSRLLRKQFF